MLLIAATALASTNLGWPCSRLNWAWRNVWSTCSINSYIPTNVAPATADFPPAHFRRAPLSVAESPNQWLQASTGHIAPSFDGTGATTIPAGIPKAFCDAMLSTNGGTQPGYQLLRNRCRRAVDAYGGIVRVCALPPAQHTFRGPIQGPLGSSILSNFEPGASHAPHAANVAALAIHARRCTDTVQPGTYWSPASTCPGLQGWWSVVWNVCGFRTYVPNIGAGGLDHVQGPNVAPLGGQLNFPYLNMGVTASIGNNNPNAASAPDFAFCSPMVPAAAGTVPRQWNMRGPTFRTTRCRRALDQFGRTASRCGGSLVPADAAAAPNAPLRGHQDALRAMFNGIDTANAPNGLRNLAPLCN